MKTDCACLVVRLSGQEFALEAEAVRGMVHVRGLSLTPRPDRPDSCYLAQIEGEVLPVLAPHRLMDLTPRGLGARTCVLLMGNPRRSHAEWGLVVDSVSRVETVPPHMMRPEIDDPYLSARVKLGEKWRGLLNVDYLHSALNGSGER